jgi:hypothetical protein
VCVCGGGELYLWVSLSGCPASSKLVIAGVVSQTCATEEGEGGGSAENGLVRECLACGGRRGF